MNEQHNDDMISAGRLRAMGFNVAADVPDVATVSRAAICFGTVDAPHEPREDDLPGTLRVTITAEVSEPWKWFEITIPIGKDNKSEAVIQARTWGERVNKIAGEIYEGACASTLGIDVTPIGEIWTLDLHAGGMIAPLQMDASAAPTVPEDVLRDFIRGAILDAWAFAIESGNHFPEAGFAEPITSMERSLQAGRDAASPNLLLGKRS